jgi:hypothetical protein
LETARRVGNPRAVANAQHALGYALAREAPDEALEVLEQAIDGLQDANDNIVGSAHAMIAYLRARQDDRSGALAALRAAVGHLRQTGDRPQMAATVDWAIVIFRRFDHLEPAALLGGIVADGPLAAVNKFPGASRAHGDRVLQPIEDALGEGAYRALAARGAAMRFDEIAAFLLEEIDRLIAA